MSAPPEVITEIAPCGENRAPQISDGAVADEPQHLDDPMHHAAGKTADPAVAPENVSSDPVQEHGDRNAEFISQTRPDVSTLVPAPRLSLDTEKEDEQVPQSAGISRVSSFSRIASDDSLAVADADIPTSAQTGKSPSSAAPTSSRLIEERLRKTIGVLVRFSSPDVQLPDKMPEFIKSAVTSIRSVPLKYMEESKKLQKEISDLNKKIDSLSPFVKETMVLKRKSEEAENAAQLAEERLQEESLQCSLLQEELSSCKLELDAAVEELGKCIEENDVYEKDLCSTLDSMALLKVELSETKEQRKNLQLALENIESARAAENRYLVQALEQKIESQNEEISCLQTKLDDAQKKLLLLESTTKTDKVKLQELKLEVQRLTNYVYHKLPEMAQSSEIDRQLVTNWLLQFLTDPSKRPLIMDMMSTTLNFTRKQQESIQAALRGDYRPVNITPVSPGALANDIAFPHSKSLADKWISFLLREASGAAAEAVGTDEQDAEGSSPRRETPERSPLNDTSLVIEKKDTLLGSPVSK